MMIKMKRMMEEDEDKEDEEVQVEGSSALIPVIAWMAQRLPDPTVEPNEPLVLPVRQRRCCTGEQ